MRTLEKLLLALIICHKVVIRTFVGPKVALSEPKIIIVAVHSRLRRFVAWSLGKAVAIFHAIFMPQLVSGVVEQRLELCSCSVVRHASTRECC